MQVYILIRKKPYEIVDVFTSKKDAFEVMKEDINNYFINEKTLRQASLEMKSMIDVNKKVYEPKHFNDIMPFGQYKGQVIGELLQDHPDYLLWCCDNLDFELDEECLELIKIAKEKKKINDL